ncbi:GGDEF domain-containing protein [Qipengyuania flava]|nr:GGDEF domain-containing protein [Qipengyuania flava]MBY5964408.1 GGDEF domain-containing protein [Qipengyuania flava]MBY6010732.1 GGDEF domain-containing protein [Qipengyuania flava]MBY6025174.1 GGDEF domain-containing protein [Qipengyuania flava]
MRLYRATAFLFPRHYTIRMFLLCFLAVHMPLLAFLGFEVTRGAWHWQTFAVLLGATVVGSAFAIAALAGLLVPVAVATRGLRALRDGQQMQDIPAGGPDMAGELLESVAHALRSTSARLDELKGLALTDPLTGLLNRRGFVEQLEQLPTGAGTLALLDGDRFKQVNDRLGHAEGDRVLRALADRLRDRLRKQDMAARWGGDEFVILLRETDEQEARAIVKRVQLSLRRRPIARLDGRPVNFTVGFAPLSGKTMEAVTEAVKAADAEMYATKRGDTLQPS